VNASSWRNAGISKARAMEIAVYGENLASKIGITTGCVADVGCSANERGEHASRGRIARRCLTFVCGSARNDSVSATRVGNSNGTRIGGAKIVIIARRRTSTNSLARAKSSAT